MGRIGRFFRKFANCLGLGDRRRKYSAHSSIPVPRFTLQKLPDDTVDKILAKESQNQAGKLENKNPPAYHIEAVDTAERDRPSWKPYHNATVAVSSALTVRRPPSNLNLMNTLMSLEDFENQSTKKLRRTPTPDLLAVFSLKDTYPSSTKQDMPERGANEIDEGIKDEGILMELATQIPLPSESLDELQGKLDNSFENVQQLINKAEELTQEALQDETELRFVLIPLKVPNFDDNFVSEDFGESLEALFHENNEIDEKPLMSTSYVIALGSETEEDEEGEDGTLTPNTIACRMPLRCKTRVTEMATWFEHQMVEPDPDHRPMLFL